MPLPRIAWSALLAAACSTPVLPTSTATQPAPTPDAILAVRRGVVTVDGLEAGTLAAAPDGTSTLEPADRTTLRAALEQRARAIRTNATRMGTPFRGRVQLQLDPDVPSRVVLAALVEAEAAGFEAPWLAVQWRGETHGIALGLVDRAAVAAVTSAPKADAPETPTREGYANPVVQMDRERGYVVRVRDQVVDPGGRGLVLDCPSTPCTLWPDRELNRLVRRITLDHPRDRAVVVAPDGAVPVAHLVGALDATRDDAVTARGERTLLETALLARGVHP